MTSKQLGYFIVFSFLFSCMPQDYVMNNDLLSDYQNYCLKLKSIEDFTIRNQPRDPLNSLASKEKIAETIQRLQEKPDSYHIFLWKAFLTMQDRYIDRKWIDLEPLLQTEKLTLANSTLHGQHLDYYEYLVGEKAFVFPGNILHDVYLEFCVDKRDAPLGRPGNVLSVETGLIKEINQPYDDFMEKNLYPYDSALGLALRCKEVKETALKYPILKDIRISYDLIQNRQFHYYGFKIGISFIKSLNKRPYKNLSLSIQSGLGPFRNYYEQETYHIDVCKEFKPGDGLGELRFWGSAAGGE